jgi:hypothetical protein
MDLVKHADHPMTPTAESSSFKPLWVIFSLILVVALTLTWKDQSMGHATWQATVMYIMTGFFLVFGGFKLLDVKGFAKGYRTYDLIARRFPLYGRLYPFIEVGLGLAMIAMADIRPLLYIEVVLMTISGIGVTQKLLKKETFECACLGTIFRIPLTRITLIEDYGMAFLALLLILFG